jgi:hypothetical protein
MARTLQDLEESKIHNLIPDPKFGKKLSKHINGPSMAICVIQGVAGQAMPGGPFANLLLLHTPRIPWAARGIANAIGIVAGFIREYALLITIPAEVVRILPRSLLPWLWIS